MIRRQTFRLNYKTKPGAGNYWKSALPSIRIGVGWVRNNKRMANDHRDEDPHCLGTQDDFKRRSTTHPDSSQDPSRAGGCGVAERRPLVPTGHARDLPPTSATPPPSLGTTACERGVRQRRYSSTYHP